MTRLASFTAPTFRTNNTLYQYVTPVEANYRMDEFHTQTFEGQRRPRGDARISGLISWDDVCASRHTKKENFILAHSALLKTRKGYIGVGGDGIQSDGKVCVLASANVPVILRPPGGQDYELVSYAFVVGVIHIEGWKMIETGEAGMEVFNLI